MSERQPISIADKTIQRAKDFLRELNEEKLAVSRKTPEGEETLTFLQALHLIFLDLPRRDITAPPPTSSKPNNLQANDGEGGTLPPPTPDES